MRVAVCRPVFRACLILLLGACLAPAPPPTGRPGPPIAFSPLDPAQPDDRAVLGWLELALGEGLDCPMNVTEARRFRRDYRGVVAPLVREIACACDTTLRHGRDDFDHACVHPEHSLRPMTYNRTDGALLSADEERLVAWQHRLAARIRAGATPSTLSRREPLAAQLDAIAASAAQTGDPRSETWQEFLRVVERVRQSVAGSYACLVAKDLRIARNELSFHERTDLRGARSAAGRAMLAELVVLARPLRTRMTACDELEADPAYQRLDVELDRAYERLARERRLAEATRDQASCNDERDRSRMCAAQRDVDRLERRIGKAAAARGLSK